MFRWTLTFLFGVFFATVIGDVVDLVMSPTVLHESRLVDIE